MPFTISFEISGKNTTYYLSKETVTVNASVPVIVHRRVVTIVKICILLLPHCPVFLTWFPQKLCGQFAPEAFTPFL